ncbi:MAG: hypothetical protein LBF57_01500 [Holosporaceae bacterium]|jgi:hypothetical protein|nr:hypothetical protein [Holosporaceae bacterium]
MLSRQSLEILLDLVEIKLSAIIVMDKDDFREVQKLKICKNELLSSRQDGKYARKTPKIQEQAVSI